MWIKTIATFILCVLEIIASDYLYWNNHLFTQFLFILEENCRTNNL